MKFLISPNEDNFWPINAKCVVLRSLGAAAGVTVKLFTGGARSNPTDLGSVSRFDSAYSADEPFTGVSFTCSVGGELDVVLAMFRLEVSNGGNVTATLDVAQLPMPVKLDPTEPTMLVKLDPTEPALVTKPPVATAVTNHATVAASPVIAQLVAAGATRTSVRFANLTGDPVAIGAVGLTWATRCVVLAAGETWTERDAPNLAWYAITDAAKAATVGVQEIVA